ncbi:T9SS type A sorting domain-containing protein [Marinilongibacter aquaticus]|uniref:T9SS type A sorting domain-containing protein n=1 Tax=Marinilongibacter aquaticus TaxID=2975157 RepID=UPI0021BD7DB7|nr:T9SS type A sorting domain-containing protein [Marinilongibacter aquaticus]UBM58845.1 T9SS type A sorting domain-containing protein [Marinilongibacter aquaticus]
MRKILLLFVLFPFALWCKAQDINMAPDSTFLHNSLQKDVSLRFMGNDSGLSYFTYKNFDDANVQLVAFEKNGELAFQKSLDLQIEPYKFQKIDSKRYLIKQGASSTSGIVDVDLGYIATSHLAEKLFFSARNQSFFGLREGVIHQFDLNLNEKAGFAIASNALKWIDVSLDGNLFIDDGEKIICTDMNGNPVANFNTIERSTLPNGLTPVNYDLQDEALYLALSSGFGVQLKKFDLAGNPLQAEYEETRIAELPLRVLDIDERRWAIVEVNNNGADWLNIYEENKGRIKRHAVVGLKLYPNSEKVALLGHDGHNNFFVSIFGNNLVRVSLSNQKYLENLVSGTANLCEGGSPELNTHFVTNTGQLADLKIASGNAHVEQEQKIVLDDGSNSENNALEIAVVASHVPALFHRFEGFAQDPKLEIRNVIGSLEYPKTWSIEYETFSGGVVTLEKIDGDFSFQGNTLVPENKDSKAEFKIVQSSDRCFLSASKVYTVDLKASPLGNEPVKVNLAYPNPVQKGEAIIVSIPYSKGNTLSDMRGREVQLIQETLDSASIKLKTAHLPSGVYILKPAKGKSQKIVIE